jgi:hypothetical protein
MFKRKATSEYLHKDIVAVPLELPASAVHTKGTDIHFTYYVAIAYKAVL